MAGYLIGSFTPVPKLAIATGDELRALRGLRREHPHATHILINERATPMSPDGFRKMLERISEEPKLGFPVPSCARVAARDRDCE
jgi:hypothetical protein